MPRLRTSVGAVVVLLAAGLPLVSVHGPASAAVATVPWDFDGDSNADLAVGGPGASVSGNAAAGSVSVFMSSGSGEYSTSTEWNQDSPGVAGSAEAGDQFGYAMTSGDYNGDTYADLAVAANREDIGSAKDAGIITVLWGSAAGLTGDSVNLEFTPPNGWSKGFAFAGDSLASGDMNDDGKDELAVGAPGTGTSGSPSMGLVRIYTGGDASTFGSASMVFSENAVNGARHGGDLFGESMVTGDFNNDNRIDLAIGAPYDADDKGYSVGAVIVVPGQSSTAPANTGAAKRFGPETPGVEGGSHTFTVNDNPDSYGRTLAAGDFTGDNVDDLVIGAPGVPLKRSSTSKTVYEDAGRVQILYGVAGTTGSATGVGPAGRIIHQETAGIAGGSEKRDLFGASLDAGTASGGHTVLAIGSAEEGIQVLPDGNGTGSARITQDSEGVPGGVEAGDAFGAFVRFLSNNGADQVLAVGSPGESLGTDVSAGALYLLPSSGGLPTGAGSIELDQADPGVSGSIASGNAWGWLGDSH